MTNNMPPMKQTLSIEVDQMQAQSLAGRREGTAGKWTRGVGWAVAVLALLLFDIVLVKGYQFAEGDQNFYLPQLQAELDSSLYPDSTAIFTSTNASVARTKE